MTSESLKIDKNNLPVEKSLSQEIWEAHIEGRLTDEEYGQALQALVGFTVRGMIRQATLHLNLNGDSRREI